VIFVSPPGACYSVALPRQHQPATGIPTATLMPTETPSERSYPTDTLTSTFTPTEGRPKLRRTSDSHDTPTDTAIPTDIPTATSRQPSAVRNSDGHPNNQLDTYGYTDRHSSPTQTFTATATASVHPTTLFKHGNQHIHAHSDKRASDTPTSTFTPTDNQPTHRALSAALEFSLFSKSGELFAVRVQTPIPTLLLSPGLLITLLRRAEVMFRTSNSNPNETYFSTTRIAGVNQVHSSSWGASGYSASNFARQYRRAYGYAVIYTSVTPNGSITPTPSKNFHSE